MTAPTVLDARGLRCPVPVARARAALARLAPGESIDLLADDPMAPIDAQAFCAQEGHDYLGRRDEPGGGWRLTLRRGPARPLAVIRFGTTAAGASAGIEARVPNEPLTPDPPDEVWSAQGAAAPVPLASGTAAADGACLFAAVEVRAAGDGEIAAATHRTYRGLLRDVEAAGYPHLLRVWNFVPRINETCDGLERYMRFCEGRSRAFSDAFGEDFAERLPAASAVGCPGDALVVHLLASRRPGRHVENPRQVPAYRYPERYGPKSPTFARGTAPPVPSPVPVFVSGTASIVGHESVYPGDPARQAQESLCNVAAVLDAADVPGREGPLASRLLSMRVYVRHPEQLPTIRAAVVHAAGGEVPTAWLQAEICRRELLVEIEATARPPAGPLGVAPDAGSS